MKTIFTLAAATALATGATGLALAGPALAKDKKEEAKAPGLKLSQNFVKAAKPAQDAVNGPDAANAEPLIAAAEAAAKTDDEKYIIAQMRYVFEAKKINARQTASPATPLDETTLVKPLDALIANPSTPATDRANYLFRRAAIAYNGRQFPVAIDYFTKAREAGNTDPQLNLYLVRAKIDSGDVAGGTQDLERAIADKTAKGEKAPEEWYRLAIAQTTKVKQPQLATAWMSKLLTAYPTQKNWYEMLVIFGLQQGSVVTLDRPQTIDVLRLMRAAKALPDQRWYIEYADKAVNAGLPNEAQAVLKEGAASGKIPAGNADSRDLMAAAAKGIANEGSLGARETKARAAANGSLALQTADAYLSTGEYAKAVDLYRLAMTKGGVDADVVNLHMGIGLARSGDKAGAATAFAAVKGMPRAGIAQLWTTYLNAPAAA